MSSADHTRSQWRTCLWCYRPIPRSKAKGRYCSNACRTCAKSITTCEYCGEKADTRDHVVPRAYRKAMHHFQSDLGPRMESVPDTVPACRECNTIANDRLFDTLDDKREYVQDRLRGRYRAELRAPDWDEDELAEMGPRMRQAIEARQAVKRVVLTRVSWRGNSVEHAARDAEAA